MPDFFATEDLEDALGIQVVKALFDDDLDGTADARPLASCRAFGTSEVRSWLFANFPTYPVPVLPADVADDLKFAALDFGLMYAVRRRPDVASAMGMLPWTAFRDSAEARMKRFLEGHRDLIPADPNTTFTDAGPGVSSLEPRYYPESSLTSTFENSDDD